MREAGFVTPHSSTQGKPIKIQEISRELDVNFALEGGVRKAGARVRVTGQLLNGTHGVFGPIAMAASSLMSSPSRTTLRVRPSSS